MVEQKVTNTDKLAENCFTTLRSKEKPQMMMPKIILIINKLIQVIITQGLIFPSFTILTTYQTASVTSLN